MALQVDEACGLGFLDELGVQILVAGDEGDVHQGAVLLADGALEELGAVQEIIQDGGLLLVVLLHCLQAALLLQPLEDLAADVDAVSGRSVVHGAVVGVGLILQHGGGAGDGVLGDQVLTDDDDDHTGGADVLLNAAVDDAVLGNVHGLGQEAGRHVGNQELALGIGQGLELGAVNGVVLADVDVVGILGNGQVGAVGDVGEGSILGGSDGVGLAIELGFLPCLLGPLAGDDVVGNLVFHQVHGNHGELLVGAALEEQDLVVIGNVHQLPQVSLGLVDDALVGLGTVAHFHDGHAGALVIEHLGGNFSQNFLRQNGGTCGKIVNSGHNRNSPFSVISWLPLRGAVSYAD